MIPRTKYEHDKLHSELDKNSEIKYTNENISTLLAKLHDKSDKKIEKQLKPISVQITEFSSKHSDNIQNSVVSNNYKHPSSEYNFGRKFQG